MDIRFPHLALGLLLFPTIATAQTSFQRVVDGHRKSNEAVMYGQCSGDNGKALLVVTINPKQDTHWFYEVERGYLVNSSQVAIHANGFDFVDPPGGEYTRARMRRLVESILQGSFNFVAAEQLQVLLSSVPKAACPKFDQGDPNLGKLK
jgi:hypothetical protein